MSRQRTLAELFVEELRMEADTTRRFLSRLPADKLLWRAHEKSRTAGELALHIAEIPGGISAMAMVDRFDMQGGGPEFRQPQTTDEILHAFDAGVKDALQRLGSITDERYETTWQLLMGGKPLLTMPLRSMVRSLLLNQSYHHRGQLGVYLRLMGATVPWSYGPSGDEMPPGLG